MDANATRVWKLPKRKSLYHRSSPVRTTFLFRREEIVSGAISQQLAHLSLVSTGDRTRTQGLGCVAFTSLSRKISGGRPAVEAA